MRLLFIRHGETVDNIEGKLQGQTDGLLTSKGEMQSDHLAYMLQKFDIDYVYCSDLGRTKSTLGIIQKKVRLPEPKFVKELRERDPGKYTGKFISELTYSDFKKIRNGDSGGESDADMVTRVDKFLVIIKSFCVGKTVLIVTHNGFIKFFFNHIIGSSLKELTGFSSFPHGSIGVVELNCEKQNKFVSLITSE